MLGTGLWVWECWYRVRIWACAWTIKEKACNCAGFGNVNDQSDNWFDSRAPGTRLSCCDLSLKGRSLWGIMRLPVPPIQLPVSVKSLYYHYLDLNHSHSSTLTPNSGTMKIVGTEFLDNAPIFRNGGEVTVVIPDRERIRFGKSVSAFSLPEYSIIFESSMGPEEEDWKRGWISYVGLLSKDPNSNCFLVTTTTVHWAKSPPPSFWTYAQYGPCVTGVFRVVKCSDKISATEVGSDIVRDDDIPVTCTPSGV
ncbi:hypothetical protein PSTG_16964 [Puccinia striiformis f. sp. tritici PST-78]|uniref:Uncharacterized protein n=1 Tax=Puccinia striiformis f. sp. tritici PST-78 TaxID=1165861 RepID=A0A0L0URQ8_9BASI|nr:hypothetical protein PSTG_16964 [Puccinia striiformis f. sp. tritici PST-78]